MHHHRILFLFDALVNDNMLSLYNSFDELYSYSHDLVIVASHAQRKPKFTKNNGMDMK